MLHLANAVSTPVAPRLVTALILLPFGLLIGVVGGLGALGRLPRNSFAGVRTRASMRSAEAFTVGNRVAGPLLIAAGALAVLTGTVAVLAPTVTVTWLVGGIGLAGALALTVAGGVGGDRAARSVPAAKPADDGCAGCVCSGGGCFAKQAAPRS